MDWLEDYEHELRRIHTEMDRVFSKFAARSTLPATIQKNRKHLLSFKEPAMHVAETEKTYLLSFELPRAHKDDIDLSIHGNHIDLRVATKHTDAKNSKKGTMKFETSQEFRRSVTLPRTADGKTAKATYKEGMLRIEFRKKEISLPKRIDIK